MGLPLENIMISIIIPTTIGGIGYIAALMPQLSQEKDCEIIVIDNSSKDGTCNYLSQYDCKIVVNKIGRNFSQSNNQGAKIAQGDYLLFLNNDTTVTSGFSQKMLNVFSIDPKIGAVGCLIYTSDYPKRVQHAGIQFTENYLPYELGLEIPSISKGITNNDDLTMSVREVPSVTACCAMIKRSVFEQVNGFDEGYFTGWEDTDLMLRIREAGYKIWYTGLTHIFHKRFGSKNAGRMKFEEQNRARYDQTWVHTGRARNVLGDFRQ